MSWNKQSRPTMGQSWPELSLLSPTDRQSVEVARRETRRQIILEDIFLFSPNINCSDSSHFVSTSISVFLSYQLFLGIMCQFWIFQSEDLVARLGVEWDFRRDIQTFLIWYNHFSKFNSIKSVVPIYYYPNIEIPRIKLIKSSNENCWPYAIIFGLSPMRYDKVTSLNIIYNRFV